LKHHKWGESKLRIVWLDWDAGIIFWADPKTHAQNQKGSILINKIVEVRDGLTKNKKKNENDQNCFSIIADKRTLELEAPTTLAKITWMNYFEALLSHAKMNQH
jgi:hypothetical protein